MSLVRPYRPGDHAACLRIFRSNMPKFFTREELPAFDRWLGMLETSALPEGDVVHYSVLESGGKPVGCGGWGIRAGEAHATLIWGMIDNKLHGTGLGKALTAQRLSHFDALFPQMPVCIDTSHHTAAFYRRFGFEDRKITPDGYGPGLHRHDMERLPAGAR